MDNNKKQQQQQYYRNGNTKTSNSSTDSTRQKTSSDLQSTKHWPKNSHRRENPSTTNRNSNNNNSSNKQPAKLRPNVDKRPRAKNGTGFNRETQYDNTASSSGLISGDETSHGSSFGAVGRHHEHWEYELNSVYSPGSKKENLNHLLNFYYTPREVDHQHFNGGNVMQHSRHNYAKKHKYNKEQFLQANFQFVIKSSAKRKTDDSPDKLIDWALIEQINIQTPDEPQCPICLYPPVAAKICKCGHVYCWSCILHYLSLSDKTWRKCPICYDAIHVADLKSASIVQQQVFNVDTDITFQLMRRKKGSLSIEKCDGFRGESNDEQIVEKYPFMSSPIEEKLFAKFILAKRMDVFNILARERRELLHEVDEICPEFVFIQQALELLKDRSEKLGNLDFKEEEDDDDDHEIQPVKILEVKTENLGKHEAIVQNTKENQTTTDLSPDQEYSSSESSLFTNNNQQLTEEASAVPATNSSSKYYYFYQAEDGQQIFLHPLNVKMLQACYGQLANAPPAIKARIIQKEQHSMDEEHRRRFRCLGHLPLTCQFAVVEVNLQPPYVTEAILEEFKANILFRKQERKRRAKEERERDRKIEAINDRQMGKLIASTANINLSSSHEFPTCGFDESLGPSLNEFTTDSQASTTNTKRSKANSTSSAGVSSYSAIAIHCKEEHSPWATLNAAATATRMERNRLASEQSSDNAGETSILDSLHTNLGDVLAQALSQKKDKKAATVPVNNGPNAGKKSKKSKKMQPLFSTGMNFGGN